MYYMLCDVNNYSAIALFILSILAAWTRMDGERWGEMGLLDLPFLW